MDDGDGLYYMRARYYDPKLGRFISEDPVWNGNLYAYGENNPIMKMDPDGELLWDVVSLFLPSKVDMIKWISNKTGLTDKLGTFVYKYWLSKHNISNETLDKIEKTLQYVAEGSELTFDILSGGMSIKKSTNLLMNTKNIATKKALIYAAEVNIYISTSGINISKYISSFLK